MPCKNEATVCGSPSLWAKLSEHGGSSTSVAMNNLFVKTHVPNEAPRKSENEHHVFRLLHVPEPTRSTRM